MGALNFTSFPNKIKNSLSRSGLHGSVSLLPTEVDKKVKINNLLIIWPHNALTDIFIKNYGLSKKNYLEKAMSPVSKPVSVKTEESLLWFHLCEEALTRMKARHIHPAPQTCCQTPQPCSTRCRATNCPCAATAAVRGKEAAPGHWSARCLFCSTRQREGADGNYPWLSNCGVSLWYLGLGITLCVLLFRQVTSPESLQ